MPGILVKPLHITLTARPENVVALINVLRFSYDLPRDEDEATSDGHTTGIGALMIRIVFVVIITSVALGILEAFRQDELTKQKRTREPDT